MPGRSHFNLFSIKTLVIYSMLCIVLNKICTYKKERAQMPPKVKTLLFERFMILVASFEIFLMIFLGCGTSQTSGSTERENVRSDRIILHKLLAGSTSFHAVQYIKAFVF